MEAEERYEHGNVSMRNYPRLVDPVRIEPGSPIRSLGSTVRARRGMVYYLTDGL